MRILITGGLGFIFSHVTEYLLKHHDILMIDNCSDGSNEELIPEFISKGVNFIKADIFDIKDNLVLDVDVVIHAAAESNVDKAINGSKDFLSSNVLGTYRLLEYFAGKKQLKQFIYISTDEVYGSVEQPVDVGAKLNPSNPYSASKASGGHLCWSAHNTYKIPITEVRLCNIVGPRQANTKLLPRVIECIKKKWIIPVYDGGEFTREYMDVRNVCELFPILIEENKRKIYNLTWNQELSVKDVINSVADAMGKEPQLRSTTRKGHDKNYRMIADPIMGQIKHCYTFDETIKSMINN